MKPHNLVSGLPIVQQLSLDQQHESIRNFSLYRIIITLLSLMLIILFGINNIDFSIFDTDSVSRRFISLFPIHTSVSKCDTQIKILSPIPGFRGLNAHQKNMRHLYNFIFN